MNSKPFAKKYFLPLIAVAGLSIMLVAWGNQKQTGIGVQAVRDTVPDAKSDKKVRNLDDALDELDRAEMKLDMDKVKAEVENAMKSVDVAKMKMEMDKAMKSIDMQKMKAEIDKATREINEAKIDQEIKESMAKVDMEKVKEQVDKAMDEVKNIDMKKMNEEMKKVEIEMKDIQPKIEKEMEKAKVSIEKAKEEMKAYKSFVDDLDKEGLINKKEDYTIQHRDGELIINGKKQPADVYDKYRGFLETHKHFTLKKSDDGFNMNTDKEDND